MFSFYKIKKGGDCLILLTRIVIGIIVFLSVDFLSTNIATAIGAGPNQIGIVSTAISIQCAIVVICTMVIVDVIKNTQCKK
jgi:hypothetical protein